MRLPTLASPTCSVSFGKFWDTAAAPTDGAFTGRCLSLSRLLGGRLLCRAHIWHPKSARSTGLPCRRPQSGYFPSLAACTAARLLFAAPIQNACAREPCLEDSAHIWTYVGLAPCLFTFHIYSEMFPQIYLYLLLLLCLYLLPLGIAYICRKVLCYCSGPGREEGGASYLS